MGGACYIGPGWWWIDLPERFVGEISIQDQANDKANDDRIFAPVFH